MSYPLKYKYESYTKESKDKKPQFANKIMGSYKMKSSLINNTINNDSNTKGKINIIFPTTNCKTINMKNLSQEKKIVDRHTKDRMFQLRQKFICTAKKFIGVPYGKKYLEEHPYYNGNLFLDCCGLVRKAFNTMSRDFGFQLGKWNQCYQYDILPKEIPYSQMQPGDLVFYTAEFYPDTLRKAQIHNVVHVEIFLGDGEKTIGSRDSKGVVQIYDTFQFESENYFNIEYHFKSIDTWLRGIHKSFCKIHTWENNSLSVEKNYYYGRDLRYKIMPPSTANKAKSRYKSIYDYDDDNDNLNYSSQCKVDFNRHKSGKSQRKGYDSYDDTQTITECINDD